MIHHNGIDYNLSQTDLEIHQRLLALLGHIPLVTREDIKAERLPDPMDDALAMNDRATAVVMAKVTNGMRAEVAHAVDRLFMGHYGECEVCEGPIAPMRLKAKPTATMCIGCAADVENGMRQK